MARNVEQMSDRYYDVVVVGRSIGALCAAALLARRDFTVLLVGHGQPPPDYCFEGQALRRQAVTTLAATSPAWARIVRELAQTQTWRRRVAPLSPMLQVLLPGHRFDLSPNPAKFVREVDREFPEARRAIEELYRDLGRVTTAADRAFARDVVWPPGTFFERREAARVAAALPYAHAEPHADLLVDLHHRHPYRRIVVESARFASHLAGALPAFATARIHGAWSRGPVALAGGAQELEDVLLARIEGNGGLCLLDERIAAIAVRRGALAGVQLEGDASVTGVGHLVTDLLGEEVATLAGGRGISKRAQSEWPRIVPVTSRFVVSLLVRSPGLPSSLGPEAFIIDDGHDGATRTIHLQRPGSASAEAELLVAEVLRDERDTLKLSDMRAWVVDRLCSELPFVERHLVVVDSVHDGLPAWWLAHGQAGNPALSEVVPPPGRLPAAMPAPRHIDRACLPGARPRAEPMVRQLEVDPPGYLSLGGEPLRGPIGRTLLVGPSVVPALGQEGELLAAWSAARVVTRSDRGKARVRREMWTKLDIG